MKVLALAHGTIPTYYEEEGVKKKFYSGPSPDEVALVDFASTQGFDCLESKETEIVAKTPSSHDSMELEESE